MMKKLLFSLVALLSTTGAFAHGEGDYVFTSNARYMVTSSNMLTNGDFANATNGWTAADGGDVSAVAWSTEVGVGPDGKTALVSLGAALQGSLCQVVPVQVGTTYAVSFFIKGPAVGNTTVTSAFVNMDGSLTKADNSIEAPVVTVLSSADYKDDWKEVVAIVTPNDSLAGKAGAPMLVINIGALAEDVAVADFSVNTVNPVYDTRIIENKIAYARMVMGIPEFGAGNASELEETLVGVEAMLASNELDDEGTAQGIAESIDEAIENFLSASSVSVADLITGLDIANFPKGGRGMVFNSNTYHMTLGGGNWGHLDTEIDVLRSAIQNGFANSATYEVFHEDFPAGKYFFTAEIRNANTGKVSWPTEPVFNLETTCNYYVGETTKDITISGDQFQRFYLIGEITEDGKFKAGVTWPGTSAGGAFFIRGTQVRAFDFDLNTKVQHVQAFKAFKAQWDAAVSGRNSVLKMQIDGNYPWGKDSLAKARANWDPYFTAQQAKNWITADGKDTGVASTEELTDWADYQGIEVYTNNEDGTQTRQKYQLVRNYQWAYNYVANMNKPFTDLADAIVAAKKTRNQGTNLTGDRDLYKDAILDAIATLNEVRSATTDATMEADTQVLKQALETLNKATADFLNSVQLPDLVNIDFSGEMKENTEGEVAGKYYIDGTAGRIYLSVGQLDNTAGGTEFTLGWNGESNDVLRVGNGTGTVYLGEEMTDNDAIDFEFDIWHGKLSGKNCYVDLRNAAGARVAGFSVNAYNTSLAYNEFDNDDHKGLNILSYFTAIGASNASNAAILVDNNRTHYKLTIDYGKGIIKGSMTNPQKGTCDGIELPIPTVDDNKVAQFVIGSNYNNSDRRCWFDNLRIVKYSVGGGDVPEDITEDPWLPVEEIDGIQTVNSVKAATGAIYTINGVQVKSATKPGLYIQNGRKFVVK